ncbi:MAG: metallophosphoesterase family protein [Solirubrobacterales bacterium]
MRIAQLSDIHVLDARFEEKLLDSAIEEINAEEPDLVVVAGDLTANGYREEFEYARERLDRIVTAERVHVPGNHDARSVGYLHFEDLFGERTHARTVKAPEGEAQVVCVDSSKPDLDDGEIGRELYGWILDSFSASPALRIFVMHHHLVAIPGTGRDRNQVWDAGDALEVLRSAGVDVVLGGHRHVPHVWPVAGLFLAHSGTASTWRVRGYARPSYNLITLTSELIEVEIREPGGSRDLLARYERPSGPVGEYRCIEATQVVRRQRGGSFRSETAR